MMKVLAQLAAAATFFLVPTSLMATPIDLSDWVSFTLDAPGAPPSANWVVQPDGNSVTQTENGNPTFFLDPGSTSAQGTAIAGKIQVQTSEDDDFIGFLLGSGVPGESYLIDWKQADQVVGPPGCAPATAGLAFSVLPAIPEFCDFQDHLGVEVARANTLGSTGWEDFREYEFQILFTSTLIQVAVDGVLELNVTSADAGVSEFKDGGFAFYNFSQEQVNYSALASAECAIGVDVLDCVSPLAAPAPQTLPLMLLCLVFCLRFRSGFARDSRELLVV
ncbi:MAG: hypothetical protein AAGI88_20420 [Pseudomonadota bacterium]